MIHVSYVRQGLVPKRTRNISRERRRPCPKMVVFQRYGVAPPFEEPGQAEIFSRVGPSKGIRMYVRILPGGTSLPPRFPKMRYNYTNHTNPNSQTYQTFRATVFNGYMTLQLTTCSKKNGWHALCARRMELTPKVSQPDPINHRLALLRGTIVYRTKCY